MTNQCATTDNSLPGGHQVYFLLFMLRQAYGGVLRYTIPTGLLIQ